jgi:hypothetical protein
MDIIYTTNTDKMLFALRVNPAISPADVVNIITGDERSKLSKYTLEFDSKLFEAGLTGEELSAYIIYEISSMVDSYEIIDRLRADIDLYLCDNDDTISLRDSGVYSQLLIFAVKDALIKLSSCLYKADSADLLNNKWIEATDLEESLVSAHDKLLGSENGSGDLLRASNSTILHWAFVVYRHMDINSSVVKSTLKDAICYTGSRLDIAEIEKTIKAVDSIDSSLLYENASLDTFFNKTGMSSLTEGSLFKGLKKNGLRSIEDSLYEYSLRIKNLETEEDAMYVMRSINARLNILDDYLYSEVDISDNDRKHWQMVADRYRALREELVKKKIWNRKNYGLFYDYNQTFDGDPA